MSSIYSYPRRRGVVPKSILVNLGLASIGAGGLAIKEGAAIEESNKFLSEIHRGIKPKDGTIITLTGEIESVGQQGLGSKTNLTYRIRIFSPDDKKRYARIVETLSGDQSDRFKRNDKFNAIIRGPYNSLSTFDRELYEFEIASENVGEVTIGKLWLRKP